MDVEAEARRRQALQVLRARKEGEQLVGGTWDELNAFETVPASHGRNVELVARLSTPGLRVTHAEAPTRLNLGPAQRVFALGARP